MEKQNSVGLNMIEPSIVPGSREGRQVEMSLMPHNQSDKHGFSNLERSISNTDLSSAYEKPNYRLLQKTLSETHPRNKYNKKYSCCDICCKFDSGAHCICYTSSSSDFDKFGLGTVLYFRFLKYITVFFFLFALLSVPALVMTLGVSHDFSINGLKDYKGALYLTTLGSLQRGTTSCTQTQLNNSITFTCERGVLGPLSTLQYGRSYEDSSLPCNLFNIYSWDTQCNNNDIQFIQTSYANCEGQSSCSIELSQDFFDFSRPGCGSWNPDFNSDARFYISAYCEETNFSLFQKSDISKMTLGYIIASIDALICVIYVIMLVVLRKMEKKTIFHLEGNVQSVSGYTLKISNLPKSSCSELRRDLWKHFSEVKENGNIITYNIVDVQTAESQSLLDLQVQLANLKKKKYQLYKKFIYDWSHQYQHLSKEPTYEDIRKLASKGNKHMIKEFHDIEKIKEKQSKLKKKIEHQKKHLKHVPIAAFVTFETQKERNDAEKKFYKSHFSRFAFRIFPSFYREDINVFQGKYLKVKAAPSTDNILWANIGVSKFQKFLRRILSWIITIGFWAISFALIVVVKTKQEDASSLVQPTLDCSSYPDLTEEQVLDDIAQGSNALGLQECFCRNDFERQLLVGVCREWASQKLIVNALPFLAVFGIIVINYCLQYVFKLLSNYEKHSDISTQSTSRVIKIFVAQFLNTGVILLIVNAKFSRKQIDNFLEGTYTDLTSDWYLNVGTILLLTMILNIVNLPFVNLVFYLIGAMRRCFDRNCTCDHKSTSKETQDEWVKLYTGPEFLVDFRYAQILTIIFICFLYSPGIPILYLTSFLNLLVIYWMDKFLVLRICRLSKTFDDTMENVVRKTLFFALFFHLVSAVWTYGNSQLFSGESYFIKQLKVVISAQNREGSFFISSMKDRAIEGYNISLTVLFALFVVALLLRLFLKNTFYRFKSFCSKRHHRKVGDQAMCMDPKNYYNFIHLEDLQREKKYLEKEMYDCSDNELKAFLGQRLEKISKEIQKRNPEEENRLTKFCGPFSYFVGHNKAFQPMFPIEDVPFPHAPMI